MIEAIKKGNVYEVTIGLDEKYNISSNIVEEIAQEWGLDPEEVAQLRGIVKMAESGNGKKMTHQEFLEGYGEILRFKPIEQLIPYCLDTQSHYLRKPEKLLNKILAEENYGTYSDY